MEVYLRFSRYHLLSFFLHHWQPAGIGGRRLKIWLYAWLNNSKLKSKKLSSGTIVFLVFYWEKIDVKISDLVEITKTESVLVHFF